MICRGRLELDLCDSASLHAQLSTLAPDIVINAAAHTGVDAAETEPEAAFRLNAEGAANLARAAAAAHAAIIQISTDYVFSGGGNMPYVESDSTGPLNVYGRSKLAGEMAVLDANPRSIIARTAWLFSQWGSNFLKTMLQSAAEREELRIVGDQFGSPTYAQDLAQALLRIAETMHGLPEANSLWGIYHVTNTGSASRYELATAIFAAASKHGIRQPNLIKVTTSEYPGNASRPGYSVLNNGKFRRAFAMEVPDWHDAVEQCVGQLLRPGQIVS